MAAHCAQGPQLGLPQMIQSRPQFGYVGAILVWLFAYLQYAGFNVFNTLLAARLDDTPPCGGIGHEGSGSSSARSLAAAAAIFGYDLIHRMEQVLTYGFLLLFGILTIVVLTLPLPGRLVRPRQLRPDAVPAAVLGGRGLPDQLGDLRLRLLALPAARRDVRKTFCWTYGGSGARRGLDHVHRLGARRVGGPELQRHRHRRAARRRRPRSSTASAAIILIFSALGLLSVTALNMYGGSLTLISALDSFKKVRPTLAVRLSMIALHGRALAGGRPGGGQHRRRSRRTSRTSCCWCSTSSSPGRR